MNEYRIWVPDFVAYTMSAPGVGVELDRDRVIETYPVEGQQDQTIEWVETGGPIGQVRILERTAEEKVGEGIWQLASELTQLLSEQTEGQGESESAGRLRRGVLFSECLKVVREWLDHEQNPVEESDLGSVGMRDLARSAILDAVTVSGRPALKIGVPTDPRQELRSAGSWRPFTTGLREISEVERSELNVAACHSKLEVHIARSLDGSGLVAAFLRNHGPERMEIPYKYKGGWAKYVPDFFVRCKPINGKVPHIVLEGKGRPDARSEHKAWWADHWWIPCANASGAAEHQVWVRREIGPEERVEPFIASAIEEVMAP